MRLSQVAGLRDKLAVCLSKTQNDDKLIAALRKELVAATGGKAGAGRCVCPSRCPSQMQASAFAQAGYCRCLTSCGGLLCELTNEATGYAGPAGRHHIFCWCQQSSPIRCLTVACKCCRNLQWLHESCGLGRAVLFSCLQVRQQQL